jgi:dCTP deaminase
MTEYSTLSDKAILEFKNRGEIVIEPFNPDNIITEYSTLSDKAILEFNNRGEIVIEPFNPDNLNTSSYDVTLGEFYYRETSPDHENSHIYNMYSEKDVSRIWGEANQAKTSKEHHLHMDNIKMEDKIIMIGPGETILAHTNEFIGGVSHITTMMKTRSSLGRNFIEACRCAGWGDVGFTNRWTLEITNNSQYYTIPLVVGRRIAQIVFFDIGETNGTNYVNTGKYQSTLDLNILMKEWKPTAMLPKMYNDYEIKINLEQDYNENYGCFGC